VPEENACLPTYLLIDTSKSMSPYTQLVNDSLRHIHETVVTSPAVSEFAHMSLISFNTDAHLLLEMTDIELLTSLPRLVCDGMTNYGRAFDLVRARIDVDLPALAAAGKRSFRPAVFVITDGAPTDTAEWESAFSRLVDPSWPRHPHVITFGVGDASKAVLAKVATRKAFLAEESIRQDRALAEALASLLNSLVSSAANHRLMVPDEVEGFTSVPLEYVS
jgi:uncharacterized protein YegL